MAKIKIINEDGEEEEIEAFTPEEVNAKVAAKEEELSKVIVEKDTTLETLKREKEEILAKAGDTKADNPNFKALKDALDKKDQEISGIKNDIAKDRNDLKINGIISKVSRGNEELEKKIKFHLENTIVGMKQDTPEELQKKIETAAKLSQDFNTQGMFDGGVQSSGLGGGGSGGGSGAGVEFGSREISLGNKMGITDEDRKKYGSRIK